MSTAATAPQKTAAQAVKDLTDVETRSLLQQVLTQMETSREKAEQARVQLERDLRESEQLSQIVFGPDGLEAKTLSSLWRLANMYARSDLIPEQYRGKPENCLIALQMAQRCRVDPFAFMQSSYIVHGRPGIEGKLVIAMLNTSGKIRGRIRFEFAGQGETRQCTAIVVDRETGEEVRMPLDWATVVKEGWHLPKGKGEYKQPSKWTTIPEQMFRYRSAAFLVRAHYPEVMMGLNTVEELEEQEKTAAPSAAENGEPRTKTDALAGRLKSRMEPQPPDKPTESDRTDEPAGTPPGAIEQPQAAGVGPPAAGTHIVQAPSAKPTQSVGSQHRQIVAWFDKLGYSDRDRVDYLKGRNITKLTL